MNQPTKSRRSPVRWLVIGLLILMTVPLVFLGIKKAQQWLYPLKYTQEVERASEQAGISPSLIYAVIHTESHFDPDAVSYADAKGLMQLTDDTYQWARRRSGESKGDPQELFDPETNIHYGATVLRLLFEQFDNTETVLAAYNAGQGRIKEWLNDPAYSSDGATLHTIPYEETADYVRRVLTAQKRYQQIYHIP